MFYGRGDNFHRGLICWSPGFEEEDEKEDEEAKVSRPKPPTGVCEPDGGVMADKCMHTPPELPVNP